MGSSPTTNKGKSNSMESRPLTPHTVSHVTLLVSSGKFMSGSAFFLSPPENKKAKFAFCTLKRKGGSTQKQPFLTVRFRGALLTKSVTLEFSQDTVCQQSLSLMKISFSESKVSFSSQPSIL